MNNTTNRKKSIYLKTAIGMLITAAIAVFLILLFLRPTVYLSKQSGFPKNEAVTYENGKIRFIVPESADIINHTQIPIKMNWFKTNRLGSVVSVQPKKGKALALDFTNLKHDEIIFEITVKNLFGIKTKYDVIIDYSNYLRIFFEKNHLGQTRKPIVLPYYKLDHEFRHIKEELYKLDSFYRFDKDGKKEKDTVSKSLVFSKNEAKGHAFLVNTTNEIIVNYDFVLPGIFENNIQKTFILERISRSQKTLKTLNPKDKGLKLKFNQAPFYVTEFLGWFYYDETGNRVNVKIGEEITIPSWIKAEFKLTARYKYEISNQVGDDINKMGYVAISYFDGPERVYFAIIKKGSPVENFKPNKPGYETLGWYTDEALTQRYDFTPGNNIANKNMSLYLKSRRTSAVPHDHKITFITPAYANQLVPVYTMHGDKLDLNYSLPSMVTGYENGQFTELDYWTVVDPVSGKDTGKRFDFNTPITSDLTLKAHMRELKLPTPDRDVKFRIIDSIDGKVVYEKTLTLKDNKIQDKDKAEINAVLAQKLSEKNHLLGKFTFRDWYLNADINKKFNINDTVESGISELNVFGLYNFEASSDIPDPNNPSQPKPLDPSLIKVTFLSDTTSVLSVQTSPKNSTFKGTLPEVSKAGYRFKYWAYFKDNQVIGQFGLNDVLTENTTLYPIFEKDPNTPLPNTTVVATIVNKLLGTKEVRLVKKGELLDLNPQQYTTHLAPYLYEFSRFANENGTTFNYLTERIFSNKTIYVEHTKVAKDQVNYEIKHVFEGKEGEADRVETTTKQALVDSLVTVSSQDKLTGYEHGFELETTQSETKQVSSEFTTQFTLKYRRRRFDVNFETNFNNHFDGDVSPSSKQTVKYEGTAVEPTNPTITKPGYKYTFVQWQLKSSMNGEYVKTQAYDFSQPVTGDVDLVAYFKEEKTTSTFQIKHVIEGVDDIQEETRVVTKTANVGSTFTVTSDHRLPEFDEHFTIDGLNQTKEISADGTTVFTLNYVRKLYDVFYDAHRGNLVDSPFINAVHVGDEPEPYKAKYQAKVKKPAYTPGLKQPGYSYRFVHWQDESKMNGTYQEIPGFDFENDRVNGATYLLAYFVQTVEKVNYTINHVFEGVDDIAQRTDSKVHQALADSSVTVSRAQRLTEFDEHFTVEDQTQTKQIKPDGTTVFTLQYNRKSYTVNYEVNYNGNQFSGVDVENQPQFTQVKYQGKVQKPATNPKLTKTGYNYTFVQWQNKAAMNGTYSQIQEYDFANARVTGNTTLVAYFTENAKPVNYTINHVFEGVDDIAQRTDSKVHQALADSSVTVSRAQRLTEFDEHFTVEDQTQTKQIKPDGTTVFTLQYNRKEFTVNFEANFNGNHFEDVEVQKEPVAIRAKYGSRIQTPETPVLKRHGRTYNFVQWQDKAKMNNNYAKISEFNFNTRRIQKDITLVAYFEEVIERVNYTIRHLFEKQGEDQSLNGTYDMITETKYNQPVENGATYTPPVNLDTKLYEKDPQWTPKLRADLQPGDNSTVVYQHYRLRTTKVNFIKAQGVKTLSYEQKNFKKTRIIETPGYSMENTHHFLGWALAPNGQIQDKFISSIEDDEMNIYAITDYREASIKYFISIENANGSFTEILEIDKERVGYTHTVTYTIQDTNIYERWEADKMSLVISVDENLNIVRITVFRKKFKIVFNVLNSTAQLPEITRRYGEPIGEITHYSFRQIDILLFKLDGVKKSKAEVEAHEVTSNLLVEIKVLNDRKANHYPQTEVALSQSNIWKEQEYPSLELSLVFNSELFRTSYTRKVVFDKNEEQYEVIGGKYYKYEPIEFVQIPGNTGYFTKKIIDAIPFSLYQPDKNVVFEGSIFIEQIKNIMHISWMRDLSAPLISFSDKPASLDNALKDPQLKPQLRKEPTDYAKAIFRQHTGVSKFWRGIDFTALPHGYAQNDLSYLPIYEQSETMTYWCSVIGKKQQNADFYKPVYITTELGYEYSNPNIVRGLVLAKENM